MAKIISLNDIKSKERDDKMKYILGGLQSLQAVLPRNMPKEESDEEAEEEQIKISPFMGKGINLGKSNNPLILVTFYKSGFTIECQGEIEYNLKSENEDFYEFCKEGKLHKKLLERLVHKTQDINIDMNDKTSQEYVGNIIGSFPNKIKIKLISGEVITRKFDSNYTIGDLYDFIDEFYPQKRVYTLILNQPRTEFQDRSLNLEQAGVLNTLLIQKPIV